MAIGQNWASAATIKTFCAVTAGVLVGNLVNFLAPLVVGGLTGHGLSETRAGYIISAEFSAIALTALIVGPRVHRLSKRRLALVGCSLSAGLNALSIFTVGSFPLLITTRFAAGLVEGLAMAAAGAAVAAMATPDRVFAMVKVMNAMLTAAALLIGGLLVKNFGVAGCYGALAGFTALLLPVLLWMPGTSSAAQAETSASPVRGSMPHMALGCSAIFGLIFWMTSASLGWPFITSFGESSGMTIGQIGSVLSVSVAFGMVGGLMAVWVRFDRVWAIVIGASGCGLAWLIMGYASSPAMFVAGAILNSVAYYFTTPFVLGMSAAIDDKGRWSAIATSSLLVGMMIAPLAGGPMIEHYGISALAILIAMTQAAAIVIMTLVGKRVNILRRQNPIAEHPLGNAPAAAAY